LRGALATKQSRRRREGFQIASEPAELPAPFKTVYEPKFFEAHLSLSDKIRAWRTQPIASLHLVTIVLLLSVMAVVTASVG